MSVRDQIADLPNEFLRDMARNPAADRRFRAAAILVLMDKHHPYADHEDLRAFIHPSASEYGRPTGDDGQPLTDRQILERIASGRPVVVEIPAPPVEPAPAPDEELLLGQEFPADEVPFRASVTTDVLMRDEPALLPLLDGLSAEEGERLRKSLTELPEAES